MIASITGALGAITGVVALVLAITTANEQADFNKRRVMISAQPLIAARCRLNDPFTIVAANSGFQQEGIDRLFFIEADGNHVSELPVKIIHPHGPRSYTLQAVSPTTGFPAQLAAGAIKQFTYSLGDLISSHVQAVVVVDQSGGSHQASLTPILDAAPPDGAHCPRTLTLH